jgi:chromosomal replication initiation ATPase DnaA
VDAAWERITSWLAGRLSEGAYRRWASSAILGSLQDGELTIRVANESIEAWVRQEYTSHIRSAIQELKLPVKRIQYEIEALPAMAGRASISY